MMSFTVPDWFKSILLFYLALFGRLEDCACKKKNKQKKTKKKQKQTKKKTPRNTA